MNNTNIMYGLQEGKEYSPTHLFVISNELCLGFGIHHCCPSLQNFLHSASPILLFLQLLDCSQCPFDHGHRLCNVNRLCSMSNLINFH